MTDIRWWWWWF